MMPSPAPQSLRRSHISEADALQMILDDDENDIPDTSDDERLADDNDEEIDPSFNVDGCILEREDSDDEQEDDEESEEPTHEPQSKRQRSSVDVTKPVYHWVKKDLPRHVNLENNLIPRGKATGANSPLQMFCAHADDDVISLLTLESNRYLSQLKRKYRPVTENEMRKMFGICFYMSIVVLPSRRMYWSPVTRQPIVARAMTLNRFEEILSVLHVNDNELIKKTW